MSLPKFKDLKRTTKRVRPKVPKSEYDADGNPILTIPDLNDIQLTAEIDKYFGEYDEEEE